MPTIPYSQLDDYLFKIIRECFQEVADKANERLRYNADEYVYINHNNYYAGGSGSPTYDLKESIVTDEIQQNGNVLSTQVHHDKNLMRFQPDDFIHSSRYWREGITDIRELLPKIINDGLSGDLFGDGWWTEERPYFSNTIKELQYRGLFKKWFKEALLKRGIKSK